MPLLEEQLFLIQSRQQPVAPQIQHEMPIGLEQLQQVPLILPSSSHGLRSSIMASFTSAGSSRRWPWKSTRCPC
jgi:LysR family tcuABC transcriptional regulator